MAWVAAAAVARSTWGQADTPGSTHRWAEAEAEPPGPADIAGEAEARLAEPARPAEQEQEQVQVAEPARLAEPARVEPAVSELEQRPAPLAASLEQKQCWRPRPVALAWS